MSWRFTARFHLTVLLVAAVLTLSVRAALTQRYSSERRALNEAASRQRSRELANHWNGLSYTETKDAPPARVLGRISWPADGLSELQRTKLGQRLSETLDYLQHPRLDDYYHLKTGGPHWGFALSSQMTNEFAQAIGSAQEPRKVVEKLWEATGPPLGAERPRLAAINLDRLTLVTSRTNSRSAIVNGPTRKGLTVLRVAPEPGFVYAPRHTSSEGGGPDELYAHLSFYARSNNSTNAGPVYLSLAWSESDQQWVRTVSWLDGYNVA